MLLAYDVIASQVHVRMLERVGLLAADEANALADALAEVPAVPDDAPDEDVHSYLERCLTERLGPLGRKVHAGRSRNDQVAVATRLWAKDVTRELALGVAAAQEALVACARANEGAVLPGYTHLQRAQPILLGHYLAAHAWMLERDAERLRAAHAAGMMTVMVPDLLEVSEEMESLCVAIVASLHDVREMLQA